MKEFLIGAVKVVSAVVIVFGFVFIAAISSPGYYDKYTLDYSGGDRVHITFKDGTLVDTDIRIVDHVLEFYDEAYKYGINVDSINKHYVGVFIEDLRDDNRLGETYLQEPSFSLVNKKILDSYNTTRLIVFHEMAHKYLYPRNHCHIQCKEIYSSLAQGNIYGEKWEDQKRRLFTDAEHEGRHFPRR